MQQQTSIVTQVSAGFDAHWRDPLAGLQFRTSTFHYLAAQVKQLANAVAGMVYSLYSLCSLHSLVKIKKQKVALSFHCLVWPLPMRGALQEDRPIGPSGKGHQAIVPLLIFTFR